MENFTPAIESLKMIPSGGGLFEVLAGDTLVFSKKAEGRHAEEGEVLNLFSEAVGLEPAPRT